MAFYDPLLQRLRQIMALSSEEATRWQRTVQFSVRLTRHCWQQFNKDNAPQMAAALTYRTIFGLVPLFVLALIVFRAFGGFEQLGSRIEDDILNYLGISHIAITETRDARPDTEDAMMTDGPSAATQPGALPEEVAGSEAAPPTATQPGAPSGAADGATTQPADEEELRRSVRAVIDDLQRQVADVSFTSIGVVGLVVLIWAAIGLVVTVEDTFNQVFVAPRGRSWTSRVTTYWAVITLGPVLVGLSLWLTGQVVQWIGAVGAYLPGLVEWVLATLSRLTAFGLTWILLTLLYVLLPNTNVRLRPALAGAFVGALAWELAKWGFQLYVQNAVGYSALYGSLGLIPLFLLWVYVTWLLILFGLELTYALQTMGDRRDPFARKPEAGQTLLDPRWLVPWLATVGQAFERGETVTAARLADRLSLSLPAVTRLGEALKQAGLVHELHVGEDGVIGYTLARPPQRITLAKVLEVGQSLTMDRQATRRAPGHHMVERLGQAQFDAADDLTLAHVMRENDGNAAE